MNLENIMSRGVISCSVDDSVVKICNVMKDNDVGFVPITRNRKVVGVITDRDIAVKIISNNDIDCNISNYISKDIIGVSISDSIDGVLDVMKKNRIKRVLVCDDKKVVGVLSISDFINYNIGSDDLMDSIKSIWSINANEHCFDTDIDDFYL